MSHSHLEPTVYLRSFDTHRLQLTVEVAGPDGTPYESGPFVLQIAIPEKYPFEAPQCMLMVVLNF
jgi:ubiquitin-protein ligase